MDALLLCWNVAGRVRRMPEQRALVTAAAPDVICLQEVTPSTAERWRQGLAQDGWPHCVLGSPDATGAEETRRPLLALTASRSPLQMADVADAPWPERIVATRVRGLELVNVHSPISARPGLVKVLTHEAVYRHLATGSGPRAVCGDLNTPRKEHPDGRVWTFARTQHGKLRTDRGERWDEAELALIQGLGQQGFRDCFRELHGPQVRELSWEWARWGGGYRLDHLIVSSEVTPRQFIYLHDWRRAGLSDHSPLLARISWTPSRP